MYVKLLFPQLFTPFFLTVFTFQMFSIFTMPGGIKTCQLVSLSVMDACFVTSQIEDPG